ncbi:MAG: carbohydrate kinase family protein [Pseudomonadota bacterium]
MLDTFETSGQRRPCDLLALGDPCIDLVVRTAAMPRWDDKILGQSWQILGGGTTCNVACAAARLGLKTAVHGTLGQEPGGLGMQTDFARFGVDTRYLLQRPDAASAMAVVLVSPTGERSVIYIPMQPVETNQSAAPRSDLAQALREVKAVYMMPYDPHYFAAVSRLAHQAGTEVIIDVEREVAKHAAGLALLLGHSDLIFFNEEGFRQATGHDAVPSALRALYEASGARCIVASLGSAGAIAIDETGIAVQPAYPAQVMDTTGAGDTFNAAFLYMRWRGSGLRQCLGFACAAASRTVAFVGARTGMPTADQVADIISQFPHLGSAAPC